MNPFLFYKVHSGDCHPGALPGYSFRVWKPGLLAVRPKGLPCYPFAIWWFFHHLRLFANGDYVVVLIYHRDQLVHRSVVTPKYFRFPFMGDRDLQVGDTWTDPAHRQRGLATFGLSTALVAGGIRDYWYLVEKDNLASIRVVEKLGFRLVGAGSRTARFGLPLLGDFSLREIGPSGLSGTAKTKATQNAVSPP